MVDGKTVKDPSGSPTKNIKLRYKSKSNSSIDVEPRARPNSNRRLKILCRRDAAAAAAVSFRARRGPSARDDPCVKRSESSANLRTIQ